MSRQAFIAPSSIQTAPSVNARWLARLRVIRLIPNEEVTHGLGICEGIEDGLAVLLSGWSPVWAAASAGAISRFPVLPGIREPNHFSDYEEVRNERSRHLL